MPFLAYDIDAYIYQNRFAPYVSAFIILLAMGAGMITSLVFTLFFNGYIIARDITHGAIAGAIATGAGSLYIFVPGFAILTGAFAGFIQAFIQNYFERKAIRKGYLISTVSWSLFGVQGFIGGFFATFWKMSAVKDWFDIFNTNVTNNYGEEN